MKIPHELEREIIEYCKLNDIPNIDEFNIKLIRQGFTAEKYGSTPFKPTEVIKEVEVIVEKEIFKEIPVEVIKEVEVVVEKEVYVTDEEANIELTNQISKLEGDKRTLQKEVDTQISIVTSVSRERNTLKEQLNISNNEILELKQQLEDEKSKPKEKKNDIYGESKKGYFGSNTKDIYGK